MDWNLRSIAFRRFDNSQPPRRRTACASSCSLPGEAAAKDTLKPELPDVDLPVDFMVKRARVREVYFTSAEGESAFVVNAIELDEGAFRDTLGIGKLVVQMPTGRLELAGRARPSGRYAVDLSASGRSSPKAARSRGRGRIVGTLDTLRSSMTCAPFPRRMSTRSCRCGISVHGASSTRISILATSAPIPSSRASGRMLRARATRSRPAHAGRPDQTTTLSSLSLRFYPSAFASRSSR